MTPQLLGVANTYLTRRWLVIAVVVGTIFLAAMLISTSQFNRGDNKPSAVMVGQVVGFAVMMAMLVVAQQGKWQFVHPRARLTPGYAVPHLAVLLLLSVVVMAVYPLCASSLLGVSAMGVLAMAALLGASVVWQIQTLRFGFTIVFLALIFSFANPTMADFWLAYNTSYLPLRLAMLLVGWAGIAMWLRRLTRMTEQDDDYLIPVQASAGNASRMEKSEARRFAAAALSRSWTTAWITDRWHDRLAMLRPHDELERPRLFRYGMVSIPAPVMGFNFMLMAAMIAVIQIFILSSLRANESGSTAAASGVLGQFGMLSMLVMAISCQFLSMRRARLPQDLLLPLTREAVVDGLIRSAFRTGLWAGLPTVALGGVAIYVFVPEYFTWPYIAAACLTIASLQPLVVAVSLRIVLVQSSIARTMLLASSIYPLVGLGFGMFWVSRYYSLPLGVLIGLGLAIVGYVAFRWVRRCWLNAEFG